MNLKQLAETTPYTPDKQRYFLAHLKEIEALDFVYELCSAAYKYGFNRGQDYYNNDTEC